MTPKMLARLAPMRSWISALPLRSTQQQDGAQVEHHQSSTTQGLRRPAIADLDQSHASAPRFQT